MKNLTKTLLSGIALSALAAPPAVAGNAPEFLVQALHAGRVLNKTKVHNYGRTQMTYTFGVSTSVPASDFNKSANLLATYYKWSSDGHGCGNLQQKIEVPKKSVYGNVRPSTLTYSLGCTSGWSVLYGDTYKLKDKSGFGKTDTFVSILIGKWQRNDRKYKGTANLDVSVAIGTE